MLHMNKASVPQTARRLNPIVMGFVLGTLGAPVLAQSGNTDTPAAPPVDCTVPAQGGQTGPAQSAGQMLKGPRNLADCNGVLRPPSVGDRELVEPAPPVGDTPVIRPGEIPKDNAPPVSGG